MYGSGRERCCHFSKSPVLESSEGMTPSPGIWSPGLGATGLLMAPARPACCWVQAQLHGSLDPWSRATFCRETFCVLMHI